VINYPSGQDGAIVPVGDYQLSRKRNFSMSHIVNPSMIQLVHSRWLDIGRGGGVLPEKLGKGVLPSSQNPYTIFDQNMRFFSTLFMTFVAGTVALNISYKGLLLTVLLIMLKK